CAGPPATGATHDSRNSSRAAVLFIRKRSEVRLRSGMVGREYIAHRLEGAIRRPARVGARWSIGRGREVAEVLEDETEQHPGRRLDVPVAGEAAREVGRQQEALVLVGDGAAELDRRAEGLEVVAVAGQERPVFREPRTEVQGQLLADAELARDAGLVEVHVVGADVEGL